MLERLVEMREGRREQGFIQTGMGSTFPRSRPEMVLKALWFHFADK